MRNILLTVVLASAFAATGCDKSKPQQDPPKKSGSSPKTASTGKKAEGPDAEAEKLFKTRCVVCHGADGKGKGAGAAALKVKPRDYTDKEWQKTVTDDDLKKIIVKGGAGVGKDPGMPANADLESKPEVVAAIVKKIRGFGK